MDRKEHYDHWTAHEQPERPLTYGAWLCDCHACLIALKATARIQPALPIVLKTGMDRIRVPAVAAAAHWEAHGGLESLLRQPGDYIREVFVGRVA